MKIFTFYILQYFYKTAEQLKQVFDIFIGSTKKHLNLSPTNINFTPTLLQLRPSMALKTGTTKAGVVPILQRGSFKLRLDKRNHFWLSISSITIGLVCGSENPFLKMSIILKIVKRLL